MKQKNVEDLQNLFLNAYLSAKGLKSQLKFGLFD